MIYYCTTKKLYTREEYLRKPQIAWRLILNLYGTYDTSSTWIVRIFAILDAPLLTCPMKGIICTLIYRYRPF
jgi:hypothetical protein